MQAGVGSMVKPDLEDLWTGRCDLGADGILAREKSGGAVCDAVRTLCY